MEVRKLGINWNFECAVSWLYIFVEPAYYGSRILSYEIDIP